MTENTTSPALRLRAISKSYGSVTACAAVDLDVKAGEIHGVLGENGAGKSTLMKILLGLVRRDGGSVMVAGREAQLGDPQEAAELGLGMVHQHFSLIEGLRVWENVALGDTGRVDRAKVCREIEEVAARYGLTVDPHALIERLSAGECQRVEVIKCLRRNPQILILDEPTSVLTQAESDELFSVLRTVVRDEGRAVILISHKLAEITAATDQITVLRKGAVVFRAATAETSARELARHMVGRDVSLSEEGAALGMVVVDRAVTPPGDRQRNGQPAVLEITGLSVRDEGMQPLDRIDLRVRAGEIVALYGVEGSGQSTLGDVLSGLMVPAAGTIAVDGVELDVRKPGALRHGGVGIIPEDRHKSGVALDMSIAENLFLKSLGEVSGRAFLHRSRMRAKAEVLAAEFNVIAPSVDVPLRHLSGGNQQRVVLARELSANPRILVAAQPTHGLDVGAIEDMYMRLRDAASAGIGILLISTELEEVMALASWITVISSGRIVGTMPIGEATPERLGMMVGGEAA